MSQAPPGRTPPLRYNAVRIVASEPACCRAVLPTDYRPTLHRYVSSAHLPLGNCQARRRGGTMRRHTLRSQNPDFTKRLRCEPRNLKRAESVIKERRAFRKIRILRNNFPAARAPVRPLGRAACIGGGGRRAAQRPLCAPLRPSFVCPSHPETIPRGGTGERGNRASARIVARPTHNRCAWPPLQRRRPTAPAAIPRRPSNRRAAHPPAVRYKLAASRR